MMLIATYGLTKYYGSVMALNDLTIAVKEGTVGLLGPNGAGKSTLLRILLGLIKPSDGRYELLGNTTSDTALNMVGYMPEHDCLPPGLTAVGFVSYAGQLSGLPPDVAMERTHQTLDYVGLG
jgi:ABC-2 type transport system ATP-binding protein